MKVILIITAYLSLSIFNSCKVRSNEDIFSSYVSGQWVMTDINYSNINYKNYLYSNYIHFREDKTVSIPETAHYDKQSYSFWHLQMSNEVLNELRINSENKIFNRSYNVNFIKNDRGKVIRMTLRSDSVSIKLDKLLQNLR